MAELSNNACRFASEIAWLQEAARYFSKRPTGGEDSAHWSNVYNAENANKIASHLDALSSRPAPMEAVAWREKVEIVTEWLAMARETPPTLHSSLNYVPISPSEIDAIAALIPTQGGEK